jgi:hypothetical protein
LPHHLDSNKRADIVKEIAHIHFPVLQELFLWTNGIESAEELIKVDMPHISTLSLGEWLLM